MVKNSNVRIVCVRDTQIGDRMFLYHASTAYQVLCCIVHKLKYYPEEQAVFMIVEHILPKNERNAFIDKLDRFSWFQEIISVPEGNFRLSHGKALNTQSSESDILEVIHNICHEMEQWYPSGFRQFQEIYVASDQWSLGVYLLYHKIPYFYMEDASGMLGDEERYLSIIRDINLTNYVLGNYLNGSGRNEIVIKKLCDMKNQPEGFQDDRAIDFSIYHIVKELPPMLTIQLLELYGARQYKMKHTEQVVIFMTQFLRTLAIKNLKVQEEITTLLLDYFARDCTVIIKPHPKDRWIDYRRLIPNAVILDNSLPSELLPFVLEEKVQLVLTASSTSIGGMTHIADKAMSFGTDIEVRYNRLHELYGTARILHEIFQGQKIKMYHLNSNFLEHFLSMYPQDFTNQQEGRGCIYIDGGQYVIGQPGKEANHWQNFNERKDIHIYLNDAKRYEFLTRRDWKLSQFIVVQIVIRPKEDHGKWKDRDPIQKDIWIYCEEEEERMKILSINETKQLKNSRLEIEINSKEAVDTMIMKGKMMAMQYALRQKEFEEQDPVYVRIKEVMKQYQEEEVTKRMLLEEEGILYE